MKPIEEGCLAMVVNSTRPENLGKVGTVGKFLGAVPGFRSNENWEFSTPITSMHGYSVRHFRGDWLMRIDGYEEQETKEARREHELL